MRKSICALVVCCMLILNAVAFASEMPVVSVKDGIEMSKVSYDNLSEGELQEDTSLTITMSARASEESSDRYTFVAVLYDANIMIDIDSDVKSIGTEMTSFEVSLSLPDDVSECRISVALLKKTEEGFMPISKASYCPTDSKFLKLVKVTADGKNISFDNELTASVSLAPTAIDFPEVFKVQTAEASTTVDLEIDETFPGDARITATLPNGEKLEYTMTFVKSKHILTGALEDEDYADADKNSKFSSNKVSKDDILTSALDEGAEGMISYDATYEDFYLKSFSNLSGVNESEGNYYGSRWTTDIDSNQVHAINYVHPSIEGNDYFITKNGELESNPGLAMFEFDISYDAEIVILAYNKVKSYPLDGWKEAYNSDGFIRANDLSYKNSALMAERGYTISYNEAKEWDKTADSMIYYNDTDGGNEAYNIACSKLATSLTKRYERNVTEKDVYGVKGKFIYDEYAYTYAYSKEFKLEDGEDMKTVTIYGPDTNQLKGLVVVLNPITPEKAEEPYEEATLKAIEIDGWQIADFKEDEFVYEYKIDPRSGVMPEVKGIANGTGLNVDTKYSIAEDGKSAAATITVLDALNPEEASNTYKVEMTLDDYKPSFVKSDYEIVDLNGTTISAHPYTPYGYSNYGTTILYNGYSSAAVASEYQGTGYLYTNLHGIRDKDNPAFWGSMLYTNLGPSWRRKFIFHVDPMFEGSQFFPFTSSGIGALAEGTNILKFNVTSPCKVSIITASPNYSFDGFTYESIPDAIMAAETWYNGSDQPSIYSYITDIDANDPYVTHNTDVPLGMLWDMSASNVNRLNWDEYYNKWFKDKTTTSSADLKLAFENKFAFNTKNGVEDFNEGCTNAMTLLNSYDHVYSKVFQAGEVVVPRESNGTAIGCPIVVITPYEEVADKIIE